MTTFMDSVERLLVENRDLVANNENLRAKAKALRAQIREFKNDEERLLEQMNKADVQYQRKRGSLAALQESLEDAVQVLADLQSERLMVEEDLEKKESEDGKLQEQLEAIQKDIRRIVSVVPGGDHESLRAALQSEKVALDSALIDSTKRIEVLQDDLQGMTALTSTGADQIKALEQENVRIREELARKEDGLRGLKQQAEAQKGLLDQLLNELSAADLLARKQNESAELDLAHRSLQSDVAALEEQAALLSVGGAGAADRRKKDEDLLKDLSLRNTTLTSELSRMQQEMVKLDKKKASLERTLYQPEY
jgi:chromosome segregation ATPase